VDSGESRCSSTETKIYRCELGHYIRTIAAAKAASPKITEPIKQRSIVSMAILSAGRPISSNVQKRAQFPSGIAGP
jgi:hypothetical protein